LVKLSDLENYAKSALKTIAGDEQKPPHVKLDDVDLVKRDVKNGSVKEIRNISSFSVYGKRAIVELPVPGSEGNIFQDMGRNPTMISFEGELMGPNSVNTLNNIKKKFELKKPVKFESDIALVSGITKVVIEKFNVHFMGGISLQVNYSMVLKEQSSKSKGEKKGPGETEPPPQEKSAEKSIIDRVSDAYDKIMK
jgi:hypothetical protein